MNKVKYESLLNCKEGKELDFICDNIEDVSIERILETLNSGSLVYVNPAATYEQLRVAIRYFNSTDKEMKRKIIELFINEYKPEHIETNNYVAEGKPEPKVVKMPIYDIKNDKEMKILKSIIHNNTILDTDGYLRPFYFRNIKDFEDDLKNYEGNCKIEKDDQVIDDKKSSNSTKITDDSKTIKENKPERKVIDIPIARCLGDKINIFGNEKEINILKPIINNSIPFMDGYRPHFYFRSPKDYNLENDLKKYIDDTFNIEKHESILESESDVVKIVLKRASEALDNHKKEEIDKALNPIESIDFSKVIEKANESLDSYIRRAINSTDFYTLFKLNTPIYMDKCKKFENIDVERFIEENTITAENDTDDYRELDIEKSLRKSTFINTLNNAIEFLEILVDDIDENYMFEDDEEKYQELVSKVIFNHLIQLSLGIY